MNNHILLHKSFAIKRRHGVGVPSYNTKFTKTEHGKMIHFSFFLLAFFRRCQNNFSGGGWWEGELGSHNMLRQIYAHMWLILVFLDSLNALLAFQSQLKKAADKKLQCNSSLKFICKINYTIFKSRSYCRVSRAHGLNIYIFFCWGFAEE